MSTVAVVQTSPVIADTPATIDKVIHLMHEAAAGGAEVAVFPEALIGGYPKGTTFGSVLGTRFPEGRDEYQAYAEGAVSLEGEEVQRICEVSAELDLFVVIGVIEQLGNTLYCTAVMIDPGRGIVGNHRKLMPTAVERLVWGFGDGSTLDVADSSAGRVGTAICWENYMPLFRQAMYAKGVELWCAPTVDDRPQWQASMTHIALEGRTFVLSACQALPTSAYPEGTTWPGEIGDAGWVIHGGSVIISPLGEVLAGPVYDEETILYADIDLAEKTRSHIDLDVNGHYARPDVFQLHVDARAKQPVTFTE